MIRNHGSHGEGQVTANSEMRRVSLDVANAMSRSEFIAAFGAVFEHSPWIAERAFAARPFADVDALHAAMVGAMRAADPKEQRALIRAHPDLAGKAAIGGELTAASRAEQSSAGLDHCTAEELARLRALNAAYRKRHGIPFVMAVRGRSRQDVLAALAQRLDNPTAAEFERALDEIAKIAHLRLAGLIAD